MNSYQEAFRGVFSSHPFYGNILLNATVTYDSKTVPTAGVRIKNKKLEFIFNRDFMLSLTELERQGVLIHEVLHVVMSHVNMQYRRKHHVDHQVWNIAEDCAINQYIPEDKLPKTCITPESLSELLGGIELEKMQSSEYYYNKLKEHKDKLKFVQTMDQHGMSGDEGDSDFLGPDEMQAIVGDIVDKAMKQSNGNVPGNLSNILSALNKHKVNWKQRFRNFIGKAASNEARHTRKKLNRRYGFLAPGRKKKRTIKIAYCTDSSGSVSDEQYAVGLSEAQGALSAIESEIYLIQADCEVTDVRKYKARDKVSFERKGYGGTAYQPAIDKAMELEVDMIIYFGDFDCADKPNDPGIPFLWLGVGRQDPPGAFGEVIRLDDLNG